MKSDHHPDDRSRADEADALRIHRQLLGDLSPGEFQQLEHDLIASPSLRERFKRAVRIDVALRDRDFEARETGPWVPVESRWLKFSSVVTAIAAVLFLAAMVVWRTTPAERPSLVVAGLPPAEFATLVDARDCVWAGDQSLALEKRLAVGVLELASGVAVIEFDGGARLALQGPSSLELIGPKIARLHHGNASVRCEQGLYSFSLLTPTSTVVDLGTEFGVAVDSEGASVVHVLDGAVEIVDTLSQFEPGIRFLNAGQTLALASNGTEKPINTATPSWIRDYSTPLDREAEAQPPRLIARDPFPINHSQPNRFALGTGWKGRWWQATEKKPVGHRFVPMSPLTKSDGADGLAMLVGGWVEVRRVLEQPIDPSVTQTVYVGLSMVRTMPESRDEHGRMSEATFLLRNSKNPTAVLGMGLSPLNYWVVSEQGGWERSDRPETGNGPFFMVAKIEFNPLSGNKVSMMAYEKSEEIPSEEPEKWDFVTHRSHVGIAVPLDTVALRVRHRPFKFGELSLGNSWQAVVNPSSAE